MILTSQPKQLRLQDDGQILWQADASNPLPGVPVARVAKGASQLAPAVELLDSPATQGQDADALKAFIEAWLSQHIATVLDVLFAMTKEEGMAAPALEIATRVHDALGIIPRGDAEAQIASLDQDMRRALRQRHVRLGPVLIFVPELNKPAAVRLRALLWWLWNDRQLPAPVPRDGAVSAVVDEAQSDPVYYRAIGYPLYGGRAIRVDMLDRVINAVYDSAKDGSFKATHAMAEWLGCSIPDLYKVLESMGHVKTADPADNPAPVAPDAQAPVAADASAPAIETPPVEAAPAPTAPAPAKPKPELATFRLKRGKANQAERPPRAKFEKKPDQEKRKDSHNKDRRPKPKHGRRDAPREEKKPLSFEAKPKHIEDSPFAVLQNLKSGMKDR